MNMINQPTSESSSSTFTSPFNRSQLFGWLFKTAREYVPLLLLSVILYVLINLFISRAFIQGNSMEPIFLPGDYLMVSRFAYSWGKPQRGDIIVFSNPDGNTDNLIKRIIGLPGDEIVTQYGKVLVNGQELNEPYISQGSDYSGHWKVPAGRVFVLGDNRVHSIDSRFFKDPYLPISNIVGKAILVYWPLNHFKILTSPTY